MPTPLTTFDHHPRTRLIFGAGCVEQVGVLARQIIDSPPEVTGSTTNQVLLVTDPGIVKAGHADRVQRQLASVGLDVAVFDQVNENPTTADVESCLAVARKHPPDLIVGLGGGSSMDTAKGCNFILTNGGRMEDYWGAGKAARPMLPLIAIPTTAGTGSECQSFALLARQDSHMKMACGDPKAAPRIAMLDPTLTLTQPRVVSADTGIDAIAHAVETAVTTKRNALSLLYARESFKLTAHSLERVLEVPDDLEARGRMLLGAAYAGIAIECSMLGAAHAAANPLTAHHNVIHGQAVGVMLPHVIRFNAQDDETRAHYAELARIGALTNGNGDPSDAVDRLVRHIEQLLDTADIAPSVADYGVKPDLIPTMAAEAAQQWTASFNPRTIGADDFERLYEAALQGRAAARA